MLGAAGPNQARITGDCPPESSWWGHFLKRLVILYPLGLEKAFLALQYLVA